MENPGGPGTSLRSRGSGDPCPRRGRTQSGDSAGTAPGTLHPFPRSSKRERDSPFPSPPERPRALHPAAAFSSQREPPGLVLGCPGKINIQRLLSAPSRSFPSAASTGGRCCGDSGWGSSRAPKGWRSPSSRGFSLLAEPIPNSPGITACGTLPLKTSTGRGSPRAPAAPREETPINGPALIINPINCPVAPEHAPVSSDAPLDAPALSPQLLFPRVSVPAAVRFGMGKWSLGRETELFP